MIAGIEGLTGDPEAARGRFQAALATQRAIGDRVHEGMHLANYAAFLMKQDELDEAIHHLERAAEIAIDIGDTFLEGLSLRILGGAFERAGRGERAMEALLRAEPLLRRAGDPLELGRLLCRIGMLELSRGQIAGARGRLREAERIAADAELTDDAQLHVVIRRLADRIAEHEPVQ